MTTQFLPWYESVDHYNVHESFPETAAWIWKLDADLKEKWPDKKYCKEKGYDQKQTVANYHVALMLGKEWVSKVRICLPLSYSHLAWRFQRKQKEDEIFVMIRVHLPKRLSQYMGWATSELINDQPRIHYPHPKSGRYHVLFSDTLLGGLPS